MMNIITLGHHPQLLLVHYNETCHNYKDMHINKSIRYITTPKVVKLQGQCCDTRKFRAQLKKSELKTKLQGIKDLVSN